MKVTAKMLKFIFGLFSGLVVCVVSLNAQKIIPERLEDAAGVDYVIASDENGVYRHNDFYTWFPFAQFWTGATFETVDVDVSSNGTTITLDIEELGGGDIDFMFSDGRYTLDATPAASITLTAGSSDDSPARNYVYVLESTKALTVSTSGWPAANHSPIADVLVGTAATTQTIGAYKVHVWTDHVIKHAQHVNFWIRQQSSTWISGVDWTVTIETVPNPDNVYFETTAGEVQQLHPHDMPAFSTPITYLVVNDNTTAYNQETNLNALLTDSEGVTMEGKAFTLVFVGVISEKTGDCHIMVNLPAGSYSNTTDAVNDPNGYNNYSIPKAFVGVGFLISAITFDHSPSGSGSWTLINEANLRDREPTTASSGGGNQTLSFTEPDLSISGGNTVDLSALSYWAETAGVLSPTSGTYTNVTIDNSIVSNGSLFVGPVLGRHFIIDDGANNIRAESDFYLYDDLFASYLPSATLTRLWGDTGGGNLRYQSMSSINLSSFNNDAGFGAPDNLGDHTATTNIQLGSNWLSGDGGSEGVYVDAAGQVGIGTSIPDQALEIVESTDATIRISEGILNNYTEIAHVSNGVTSITKKTASGNSLIDFNPTPSDGAGNASFRFFRNVTTTGLMSFQVLAGTSNPNVVLAGNGDSYLNDDSGNVGIGTNNPTAKLDVVGDLQFVTGNETNLDLLQSDANGNADWVAPSTIGLSTFNNDAGFITGPIVSGDGGNLISAGTDGGAKLTSVNDADASTTNELQTISKASVSRLVTLSDGGGSFTDETIYSDDGTLKTHGKGFTEVDFGLNGFENELHFLLDGDGSGAEGGLTIKTPSTANTTTFLEFGAGGTMGSLGVPPAYTDYLNIQHISSGAAFQFNADELVIFSQDNNSTDYYQFNSNVKLRVSSQSALESGSPSSSGQIAYCSDGPGGIAAQGAGAVWQLLYSDAITSGVSVDLDHQMIKFVAIDMTGESGTTAVTVSDPIDGGIYTFYFYDCSSDTIDFPSNFIDPADGAAIDNFTPSGDGATRTFQYNASFAHYVLTASQN